LVDAGRGLEGEVNLSGRDVLGQKFGALVSSQEVSINLFQVAASDEVVGVDAGLAENLTDSANISVVVVAEKSEALSSPKSQFAFDSSVELVGEGLEEDDQLDVEAGGGLGLLEEDDLDEGVDVGGLQMQIDGDQELLDGEDGQSDSRNLLADVTQVVGFSACLDEVVHEERVVVQKVRHVSTVVGHLEVRLAFHDSEDHDHGRKELDTGAHSLFIKSLMIKNGGSENGSAIKSFESVGFKFECLEMFWVGKYD